MSNENSNVKVEVKSKKIAPKTSKARKVIIDLGNANYKVIYDKDKRTMDCSNVEKVKEGSFSAFKVNGGSYIFGENAKVKYDTNKICPEKKALLGRALYPLVDDKDKVNLVTLLPLSLYINAEDGNREAYEELLKGKYTVSNESGAEKVFTVQNVEVYCESFSSLFVDAELCKKPLYLVDLGGVDLSGVFVYRTPNPDKRFSNTNGMNTFYSKLGERLTSSLKKTCSALNAKLLFSKYSVLSEDDINAINDEEEREKQRKLKNVIDEFAINYIEHHIKDELYRIEFDSDIHDLVFVGGGAEALKMYLEKVFPRVTVIKDAIYSNVEGAKRLSILNGNRKKAKGAK